MTKQIHRERNKLLSSFERLLEGPMIFLGFVWLVLLIIELVWGLTKLIEYLGLTIWVIFIIDFAFKLILAPDKIVFFKKNWLTAISLLIPALRVFRIFRFVRFLRGFRGIRLIRVVSSVNRSMNSLAATMRRRGFIYVFLLIVVVTFVGAAAMHAIERSTPGFETFGLSLWWSAMRVITAGSEYYPLTTEGRGLAFILAVFGYTIFGYVTATFASYFVGRDAEEKGGPVAGSNDIAALKSEINALTKSIEELKTMMN